MSGVFFGFFAKQHVLLPPHTIFMIQYIINNIVCAVVVFENMPFILRIEASLLVQSSSIIIKK